ncbi:N5-glutamine S-adenosyl-L-methionine-dependent methyltransferase [Endozoicomonas montiporae CL-33]|uniref:Ribosomal protein uL3 glutamine methyltransferase n=1 Tax=Endozoicomonas montiporae CL-33 TaxID=570277 RepID=A0A142BDP7_9GAMM|nr:N5-glutamine S-adenosyl-L-methionine-dependent methyltransferase [Endozoicomonas montiporae CL-33]
MRSMQDYGVLPPVGDFVTQSISSHSGQTNGQVVNLSYDGLASIRDFIRWAASRFNEAELFFGHGSDNALDEAMHLVMQVLQLPWDLPESYMDCRLTTEEQQSVAELVRRRIEERKPLAYLLNRAWFCGQPYYVDERVLVPRSPISELINHQFQPWLGDVEVNRALDLCSGSGCIGIAMAHQWPEASMDLLDISDDALDVAHINIDQHELWGRVQAVKSDLFEALDNSPEHPRYELIVSNPPYVDAEDMADFPEEFGHEPELGLAAGNDGLDMARIILARAADFLSDSGLLVLEVGNSQWALQAVYPEVPFVWPEFAEGGHGVLVLTAEQCREHQDIFKSRMTA